MRVTVGGGRPVWLLGNGIVGVCQFEVNDWEAGGTVSTFYSGLQAAAKRITWQCNVVKSPALRLSQTNPDCAPF